MITVLHTSARALETGLINFEMVTAKGTEILIESTKPILYKSSA
jgi:hypothetical protein